MGSWNEVPDIDLEVLGADESDIIVLRTDVKKCKVCRTGDLVARTDAKEDEKFMIYTRDGTVAAKHLEYRCNNRNPNCRAGHFYSYVTMGEKENVVKPRCYDRFALKKEYLVTSSQTAFSVMYLWDSLMQIIFSNASFESLANVYNNLHFVNLPTDVLMRRVQIHRKRIAEAIFLFAYLELSQRYGLPPIISGGIDQTILKNRTQIRDRFREIWSVNHLCDTKGCSSVLIVDGGMKPTRSLCAAKLNGVKEFSKSGMVVVCGCQRNPQPDAKYCGDHIGLASPAMASSDVSETTRSTLRSHRDKTASFKDTPQDNMYVMESVLDKKEEKTGKFWKIKWLGFPMEQATWEPEANVQPWIQSYYDSDPARLGKPLPEPRIKYTKKAGDEVYYYLSWDDEPGKSQWYGESFFSLASEDGEIASLLEEDQSCNTKKTKDKRVRRHTVGIMVGAKPCGTVVLFDELYGSESLTQVYGMLVEYLSRLSEEGRLSLKNILYDDACHLKKFSEKKERANLNCFTQLLAEIPKHVDNFHFKNHVDPWCHKMCNPKDARALDGVNTEVCEQTFKWVNKFTSVKSMNESRFWMFFTIIFDLRNLQKQGTLRSVAHPKSPLRWELLPYQEDPEPSLLTASDDVTEEETTLEDDFVDGLEKLTLEPAKKEESLDCKVCGAKYKKPWTLKSHMKNKHGANESEPVTFKCDICDAFLSDKKRLDNHMKTHEKIFVCSDCQEVFFDKISLTSHFKTHLICTICERKCESKYSLSRHMKSHK